MPDSETAINKITTKITEMLINLFLLLKLAKYFIYLIIPYIKKTINDKNIPTSALLEPEKNIIKINGINNMLKSSFKYHLFVKIIKDKKIGNINTQ